MSTPLTLQLGQLAERLGDLRIRLKDAARFEVANAITDALGKATHALICGRRPVSATVHGHDPDWDDPWADPYDRRPKWEADFDVSDDDHESPNHGERSRLAAALMSGLAAARWSLARSGQPIPALAIAAVVAAIILCAGNRIGPLLDVFSVAQDLLLFPDRRN